MSTYTYSLATDIGKVRRLIGDTDITPTTDAQFSDEEIQFFLDLGGSVLMGAAKALEAWAATEANNLDSERIGDYQYTRGAVNKKLTLAKEYAKQDSELPYMTWSEPDYTGGSGITTEED